MNRWINCGRSSQAVGAAIAAFQAMGGKDFVNKGAVAAQMKEEDMGISMDNSKAISYSPSSFYMGSSSWLQLADFSPLKPKFEPVTIKINAEHNAVVYEDHTVVDGEKIPNEAILRVATQIRANNDRNK